MSDPLSVLLGNGEGSSSGAPATPSKSRISSRPPPFVRPTPASPGGSTAAANNTSSIHYSSHPTNNPSVEQFPNGANQQYTSIVRSQSPLAPRPPLPGQLQRPVSPIQWNQSNLQNNETPSQSHQQAGPPIGPFSPASPNAWASSPESASGPAGSSHQPRQYQQNLQASVPGPVPVPPPIGSLGGPSRPLHSPGIPRSPVAESPTRSFHSSQNGSSGQNGQAYQGTAQQQQAAKVPPYLRIRVTGIDRAKKELGIKMDAQTNIPTYHRRQSPIFERTYNEFMLLHGALSANHPEAILPALPLPQTSATNEEEEDRFLKGVFQKFMDRITRDRSVIQDDELRSFIEADFGYTPLTKAKKLKAGSGGFLSRSSSKPLLGEDGEPDFLVTSKVHSAALETALSDTCKTLEKVLKHQTACASSYAELATALSSFSTTESYPPLTEGMKSLAEAMTHIAQLETGQTNATALVLGDSLAYEAVEAKSAKDALLQRQYNIDELRNSIKTTINKRRQIEKLRSTGNIKPERVNEALDDLEEAAKHEQVLQNRVEAISRNLRPSLQTHLKTMNDDMISVALGQARTMLAYETRKLQVYDGIHSKIARIPERGVAEQGVVYYHQQTPQDVPATTSNGPISVPPTAGPIGPVQPSALPQSTTMSPSSSHHTHLSSASTTHDTSGAQSKFMATQAAIQAEMQAQRAREERQRAQFAQARQHQHQKQASLGRTAPPPASNTSTLVPSSTRAQAQTPTSPRASQQTINPPQSPLHTAGQQRIPDQNNERVAPAQSNNTMSQSMFVPSQHQTRSPPSARRTASLTHGPASGVDPLSPGGAFASAPSSAPLPPVSQPYRQQQTGLAPSYNNGPNSSNNNNSHQQQQQQQSHSNGNMTQSVLLPGRNAQLGFRNAPSSQQNTVDERKRADARKAASFLAGAF